MLRNMKSQRILSAMALGAALGFAPALTWSQTSSTPGQDDSAKRDLKTAGNETKDAAKDARHGVKQGATTAVHATESETKKAANATAKGATKVAHATESGTKKVWS